MPTWPVSLPQKPLRDGYEEAEPSGAIRSQTDTGPPKQRNRYSATIKPFRMTIEVDSNQLDTFQAFYRTTLGNGVLPFDWTHPRTAAAIAFRFDAGQPPITTSVGANQYRVSMMLEIMP